MKVLVDAPLYDADYGAYVPDVALTNGSRNDEIEQIEGLFWERRRMAHRVRLRVENGSVEGIQLRMRKEKRGNGENLLERGVRVIERLENLRMNARTQLYRERLELVPRGKEFLLLDCRHDSRHLLRHRRVRCNGRLPILLGLLAQTPTVAHLAGEEASEGLVVLEEQGDLVQDLVQ